MVKKTSIIVIMAMILMLLLSSSAFACDKGQTKIYVSQVLFGDAYKSKMTEQNVKTLQAGLYICSEQYGDKGEAELEYLEIQNVPVPALSKIAIDKGDLMDCSHNTWRHEASDVKKQQAKRKKLLQKTVNVVFDFGFFSNVFGSNGGKCDSFAAMLYYTHILSDYLADDPAETIVKIEGKKRPAYAGSPYVTIKGDKPSFTKKQKKSKQSTVKFSGTDKNGRAAGAFAEVGKSVMPSSKSKASTKGITPSGWTKKEYKQIIGSKKDPVSLYKKTHLIGHKLVDGDTGSNVITGTRYLNANLKRAEKDIAKYIKKTGNHVLVRATPVYKGKNKLASGVQLEAYSVEDHGKGISFNRYYYNVQPGIDVNYSNGKSKVSDKISGAKDAIPFAVSKADDDDPDLIYAMTEQLEELFEDQDKSKNYTKMMDKIEKIAKDARKVKGSKKSSAKKYLALKKYEYQYMNTLKAYVPKLLNKEDFFKDRFND